MTDERTRTRILEVMARVFGKEAGKLPFNPVQGEDGDWDSLTHLELIMAIETEFGRRFRTERFPELTSLALIEREIADGG